jgi:hypothetical protein
VNSIPYVLNERAAEDMRELPRELYPAALEQLARVAANYRTCSRRTAFPRPPGWESGLWCRHPDGRAALVEVLFLLTVDAGRLTVTRVICREVDRLPDWVVHPDGWAMANAPWPVVDL